MPLILNTRICLVYRNKRKEKQNFFFTCCFKRNLMCCIFYSNSLFYKYLNNAQKLTQLISPGIGWYIQYIIHFFLSVLQRHCLYWKKGCIILIFFLFILGPPSNVFFSTSTYFVNGNTQLMSALTDNQFDPSVERIWLCIRLNNVEKYCDILL